MARFEVTALTLLLAAGSWCASTVAQDLVAQPGSALEQIPGADAGAQAAEMRRREERLRERESTESVRPLEEIQVVGDQNASDGPGFLLRSVRFTRSELLTEEQLREMVSPYLGQQVNHARLMEMIEAINRSYRTEGVYTAVAVLPQQEIKDGVVVVRLIEGKLGAIRFEGNEYTTDAFLARWMDAHQGQETVDMPRLQADILEFNRVHDERIRAELRRGESFGLTDIVVTVQEPERGFFQAFADNYGYESSGRDELGVMYRHQHLLTDGDRSIAYLSGSEGAQSLSLSYNRPLGDTRWRIGSSGSLTRTDVTAGDFATSDVASDSYRFGLESSWLAWSGERLWVNLLGAASYTRSTTEIAGVVFSDDGITQGQLGASLNWVGSQWQVSGRQMVSYTDFDDRSDVADARQATSETLYNGGLTGYYRYRDSGFYGLLLSEWQYSEGQQLPGSLSFALGGPTSIRGYLPSAISGDRGWYGQVEVHYDGWRPWNVTVEPYLFYDYGEATSLDPQGEGSGNLQTPLAATGVALSLAGAQWGATLSVAEAKKAAVPNQDERVFYARLSFRY